MQTKDQVKKSFKFQITLATLIMSTTWLVFIANLLFSLNWNQYGVHPKSIDGLLGILTFPFLHGSWEHLLSNTFPGIILLTGLFIFHPKTSLKSLPIMYLLSGGLLWFMGQTGSNHIGASGLVYALAFYLFTTGLRRGDRNSMALAFFIILWYGSMIWGIFPFSVEPGTSWEGHLAGAITGVLIGFLVYDYVPPTPKLFLKEEDEEDDVPFFEQHPLD